MAALIGIARREFQAAAARLGCTNCHASLVSHGSRITFVISGDIDELDYLQIQVETLAADGYEIRRNED
jgi:hypothetical protein